MTIFKLDIAKLLMPISVKKPTGADLRKQEASGSLYRRIKDLRTTARMLERQQMQGAKIATKPDWQTIYQLALQALSTQTKDLEITVWLIEALLREHGFAGLCEGFKLTRKLIIHYWDNLYPLPDEDGLATRLTPLIGLNGEEAEGTLIVPMALIPLTQGHSVGPFALWQYQQALALLKIANPEKRNQRLVSGAVTLEHITQAVTETPLEFFQIQWQTLQNCIQEFGELNQILAQKAGDNTPPSSRILAQLKACSDCIQTIAKEALNNKQIAVTNLVNEKNNLAPNIDNSIIEKQILMSQLTEGAENNNHTKLTREQVLEFLQFAAEFFKKTEPHSPVPYLLERAVRWSNTALPHLMKELIKNEQVLGNFCDLTGININL